MPSGNIAPTVPTGTSPSASAEIPTSVSADPPPSASTGTAIVRLLENDPPIKYRCVTCNKSHNCRKSMRHCSHPKEDTEKADFMSHKKRKKDSDALYHKYISNVHKWRR
jgi:hypothetical protein